jgi:membrane fusion protein (multidrug efflux system)
MSARLVYNIRVLFSRVKRPGFIRYGLLITGPLILALIGAYYYATGGRYVTSENAYVKADKIAISTDISGRVVKVNVQENQIVKEGEILFELDREPFQIAMNRAEAEFHKTRNDVGSMRELYQTKSEELKVADSDKAFFQQEFDRRGGLMKRGMVNSDRFDSAGRNLEAVRNRSDNIRAELGRLTTRLGGAPEVETDRNPEVLTALARYNDAKLNLSHTVIRAPADGIVTKNDLQAGEYVTAGRPIFSIVAVKDIWIEANLKETELTYVKEGQSATITVDAYPDAEWKARVSSIAPATGAEFSILPPQNATGNWVKVVQRIPVRLQVLTTDSGPPLRAGMSVIVTIDTLHERDLPPIVRGAVALIKGN